QLIALLGSGGNRAVDENGAKMHEDGERVRGRDVAGAQKLLEELLARHAEASKDGAVVPHHRLGSGEAAGAPEVASRLGILAEGANRLLQQKTADRLELGWQARDQPVLDRGRERRRDDANTRKPAAEQPARGAARRVRGFIDGRLGEASGKGERAAGP